VSKDRITFDPQRGAVRPLSFGEGVHMLAGTPAFWLLCVAGFFALGIFFTNLSWLPGYLMKDKGYTVISSGLYLILPYLAAFCGALSGGYLGDRTGNRSAVGLCMGLLTAPAILGLVLEQEVSRVILLMSLMLFFSAAAVNSLIVLLFDLFPAEVLGIAVAIFGGVFGGLGGVVGPLILGYSYDYTGSFLWGFYGLSIGALVGAGVLVPVVFYERRVKRTKAEKLTMEGEGLLLHRA
jgi:sugar phosphate permease